MCCGLAIGGFPYFELWILNFSGSHLKKTLRVKYLKRVGNYSSACLDPFNPSIQDFVKDLGKLQCTGKRYSSFINNLLAVKGEKIYSAHFRTIERPHGDDFKVAVSSLNLCFHRNKYIISLSQLALSQ